MAAFEMSQPQSIGSVSFGLGAVFHKLVAGVKSWNELRLTRKALNALSDRELADIGLHRGMIAEIGL